MRENDILALLESEREARYVMPTLTCLVACANLVHPILYASAIHLVLCRRRHDIKNILGIRWNIQLLFS